MKRIFELVIELTAVIFLTWLVGQSTGTLSQWVAIGWILASRKRD